MAIYNRKMFVNQPERMKLNSRGTGITSGLVPVMKAKKGLYADSEEYQKLYDLAQGLVPEQKGFFSQNAPALFDFFARLGESARGGRPGVDGPDQSIGLRTLTDLSAAAPALANIKPYQDPAAQIAASKLFDITAQKMLADPAEPDYLEVYAKNDIPDLKITKGQKIPILREQFDPEIHNLEAPKVLEDEYINVFSTIDDPDKNITKGQQLPILRSTFDSSIHQINAPKGIEDSYIDVFSTVDDPDKKISKGQKLPILRSKFDSSIHNLEGPTKAPGDEYVNVYSTVDDPDKKITKGQLIPILRSDFDSEIHNLEAPAEGLKDEYINVYLKSDNANEGTVAGQQVPILRSAFDAKIHNLAAPKEPAKVEKKTVYSKVDNLEKGIKKGDQLFIPVDQIDYNIHNLSDPVTEDTITVYSKIEDKNKGIEIDQGLRVKEKDFNPKIHTMTAPKNQDAPIFMQKIDFIKNSDMSDDEKTAKIAQVLTGARNVLSPGEAKEILLFEKELEAKLDYARPLIENAIQDGLLAAESEVNFNNQLATLDEAITGQSFFDTRKYLGDLKAQFPNLYNGLPPTVQTALDAFVGGEAANTDVAIALSNRATLDTASGGAIPGNLNTKEFEAIAQSNGAVFFHPESQRFIINMNIADAKIKQEAGDLMTELFTKGTVDGEAFNLADGAVKILNIQQKAYNDYKLSDEYKEGLDILQGVGDLASTEKLNKSQRPIFINDKNVGKVNELNQNGQIKFLGYANTDGVFVNPVNGNKVADFEPNSPIYSINLGEMRADKTSTIYLIQQNQLM